MTAPRRPRPVVVGGDRSHRLIRGVLRMETTEAHIARVELCRGDLWTASIVDTGKVDTSGTVERDTTFHILWEADEDDAWIETNGIRHPIAPGDTMSVPAETEVRQAAGMLLVEVEATAASLDQVLPPSHGIETFEGYNRRTDYETPGAFSLERWKITQPMALPDAPAPFALIDLAAPIAFAWPGGTDLVGRGECRVIEPGTGPITLLPDGLGYALIVR